MQLKKKRSRLTSTLESALYNSRKRGGGERDLSPTRGGEKEKTEGGGEKGGASPGELALKNLEREKKPRKGFRVGRKVGEPETKR